MVIICLFNIFIFLPAYFLSDLSFLCEQIKTRRNRKMMKQPSSPSQTAEPGPGPNLSRGYAAVFATVAIWSLPSLFMYYLNRFYDPWAQNFYRYSVACIAILPLVLWRIRRSGPRIDMRAIGLCLVPCVPNVIHQIT